MAIVEGNSIYSERAHRRQLDVVTLLHALSLASDRLWLTVITVIGAAIRLIGLGSASFWYDETLSVNIASHTVKEILQARLRIQASPASVDYLYTNNPPLHLLLIHVSQYVSSSAYMVRLPFALAGIATIPMVFVVIRRLFDREIGLWSAAIVALSPLHVAYSRDARPTAFLVIFALLGLIFLLDGIESGSRRNWAGFVLVCVLGNWSSYFMLFLVMPAYGVICLSFLIQAWKRSDRTQAWALFVRFSVSCFVVILAALPLFADLKATSEMNEAGIGSGRNPISSLALSIIYLDFLTNPIPGNLITAVLIFAPLMVGCVAMIRARRSGFIVAFIWIIVPFFVLAIIESNRGVELRYVLFVMPVAVAMACQGLRTIARRLVKRMPTRNPAMMSGGLIAIMLLTSLFGLTVPATRALQGQPVKHDWESLVRDYSAFATRESCLVLIDHTGHAGFNVVNYYLDELPGNSCAIDARDPRFLDVVATHPDLWWGIGTRFYSDSSLDQFAGAIDSWATISIYFMTMLVHPTNDIYRSGQGAGAFLEQAITILEPLGSSKQILYPALRESLANLLILRCGGAMPAATLNSLLDGFLSDSLINSEITWGRAQSRLDRGEYEGARSLAVRMIALQPGNPDVYTLMAQIEAAAGNPDAAGYLWAATILRGDAEPSPVLNFTSC